MRYLALALVAASILAVPSSVEAIQKGNRAPDPKVADVWQPAKTPPGGTSWKLLQQTKLNDRTDPKTSIIYTKPTFPAAVRALNGKQVKVAGWMMPLDGAKKQKRWVMLGYPPGCPFHFHALPNQFIEILSPAGVLTNEAKIIVMTGTMELTGFDESGIFYRLKNARPI